MKRPFELSLVSRGREICDFREIDGNEDEIRTGCSIGFLNFLGERNSTNEII